MVDDPPWCPVLWLRQWLALSRPAAIDDAVFLVVHHTGRVQPDCMSAEGGMAALIVKQRLKQAGIDPAKYSGSSFRGGWLIAGAARGGPFRELCGCRDCRTLMQC